MTQPVTFKTAVKAKEKGFVKSFEKLYFNEKGETLVKTEYPTQSELAKWLREEKGIYVLPSVSYPASDGWGVDIYKTDGVANRLVDSDHFMDTYESAYEAGLDKALDLID